jgi:glycosyltransferase involved in cell wall biosynthesis
MRHNHDLPAVWRLARLFRRLRPDVVHVHLFRSMLFGRLAARLAGVRAVLATEHSALPDSTEGRPATRSVHAMYATAERLGALTIAVSEITRDVLVRYWHVAPHRIRVIPNGIDTSRFRPDPADRAKERVRRGLDDGTRLLVATGRLVPGKRLDRVVQAMAELPDDVRLVVVGRGTEHATLARLAEELGVADRVQLVGEVPDVAPLLAAADAFVSASVVETYGIALVEAYVSGLPVVYVQSPAVDALRERHGAGRLLRCGESAAEVAATVREALRLPVGVEHVPDAVRAEVDVAAVSAQVDDLQAEVAGRLSRRLRVSGRARSADPA